MMAASARSQDHSHPPPDRYESQSHPAHVQPSPSPVSYDQYDFVNTNMNEYKNENVNTPSVRQLQAKRASQRQSVSTVEHGEATNFDQSNSETDVNSTSDGGCQCIDVSNLGCVERLFQLLRNPSSTSLSLQIPSSLVFSSNGPTTWWFTNHAGKLSQHPRERLNVESILQEFAPTVFDNSPLVPIGLEAIASNIIRSNSTSSVPSAAALTALNPNSSEIYAQFVYSSSYSLPPHQSYIVYLTALELLRMLTEVNTDLQRPKVFGILQKFVRPPLSKSKPPPATADVTSDAKSNSGSGSSSGSVPPKSKTPQVLQSLSHQNHHAVFKILWSPHYTSIERRVNNNEYAQPPHDGAQSTADVIFSKLATFDGPPSLSTFTTLTQPIHRHKFEALCGTIVRQLQSIDSNHKVKYMELFAKLDPGTGKALLLYVRSLRAVNMRELEKKQQGQSNGSTGIPAIVCLQCHKSVDFSGNDLVAQGENDPDEYRGAPSRASTRPDRPESAFTTASSNISETEESKESVDPFSVSHYLEPSSYPRRSKTPTPTHLRDHPSSFQSALTPYELSAALDFDLLAPFPFAESEMSNALRPKVVAAFHAGSPNITRRGPQLVDKNHPRSRDPIPSSFSSAHRKFSSDILGLYSRDMPADRRKQLRIALAAATPQTSTTSFSRGAPPPPLSVCRYLDPFSPTRSPHSRPRTAASTSRPTTAGSQSSRSHRANSPIRPFNPFSMLNTSTYYHSGSQTARSSDPRRKTPSASAHVPPRHAPRPQSAYHAPSGQVSASINFMHQLDPAVYIPAPQPNEYLPNPFASIATTKQNSNSKFRPSSALRQPMPSSRLFASRLSSEYRVRAPAPPTSKSTPHASAAPVAGSKSATHPRASVRPTLHPPHSYQVEQFVKRVRQAPKIEKVAPITDQQFELEDQQAIKQAREAELAAEATRNNNAAAHASVSSVPSRGSISPASSARSAQSPTYRSRHSSAASAASGAPSSGQTQANTPKRRTDGTTRITQNASPSRETHPGEIRQMLPSGVLNSSAANTDRRPPAAAEGNSALRPVSAPRHTAASTATNARTSVGGGTSVHSHPAETSASPPATSVTKTNTAASSHSSLYSSDSNGSYDDDADFAALTDEAGYAHHPSSVFSSSSQGKDCKNQLLSNLPARTHHAQALSPPVGDIEGDFEEEDESDPRDEEQQEVELEYANEDDYDEPVAQSFVAAPPTDSIRPRTSKLHSQPAEHDEEQQYEEEEEWAQ